jgi:hypothetical protein
VISTDITRTLQSGYSELIGLYPPGSSGDGITMNGAFNEKQLPPLKIRQRESANNGTIGPMLNGYVPIPIYNYLEDNINDFEYCPYADEIHSDRSKHHPEIYDNLTAEIMPIVRKPLAKS